MRLFRYLEEAEELPRGWLPVRRKWASFGWVIAPWYIAPFMRLWVRFYHDLLTVMFRRSAVERELEVHMHDVFEAGRRAGYEQGFRAGDLAVRMKQAEAILDKLGDKLGPTPPPTGGTR